VGRPLFADTVTASRETLCFARVCVEVDFDKMLPDSVTIEDDKATAMIKRLSMNGSPHLDAPIVCTLGILILVQDAKRLSHARAARNMDVSAVSEAVALPGFCLGQHKVLQILRLRQHSVQLLQCLVMKPQYLVQTFRPLQHLVQLLLQHLVPLCLVQLLLVLTVQRMMQGLLCLLQHLVQRFLLNKFQFTNLQPQ
jgi:hypothetical protein